MLCSSQRSRPGACENRLRGRGCPNLVWVPRTNASWIGRVHGDSSHRILAEPGLPLWDIRVRQLYCARTTPKYKDCRICATMIVCRFHGSEGRTCSREPDEAECCMTRVGRDARSTGSPLRTAAWRTVVPLLEVGRTESAPPEIARCA